MDLVWIFTVMFTPSNIRNWMIQPLVDSRSCVPAGALPCRAKTSPYGMIRSLVFFFVDLECPGWIMLFPSGWMIWFNISVSSLVQLKKCWQVGMETENFENILRTINDGIKDVTLVIRHLTSLLRFDSEQSPAYSRKFERCGNMDQFQICGTE